MDGPIPLPSSDAGNSSHTKGMPTHSLVVDNRNPQKAEQPVKQRAIPATKTHEKWSNPPYKASTPDPRKSKENRLQIARWKFVQFQRETHFREASKNRRNKHQVSTLKPGRPKKTAIVKFKG